MGNREGTEMNWEAQQEMTEEGRKKENKRRKENMTRGQIGGIRSGEIKEQVRVLVIFPQVGGSSQAPS